MGPAGLVVDAELEGECVAVRLPLSHTGVHGERLEDLMVLQRWCGVALWW